MDPVRLEGLHEMVVVQNQECSCGRHGTLTIVGLPIVVNTGEVIQPQYIEVELVYQ